MKEKFYKALYFFGPVLYIIIQILFIIILTNLSDSSTQYVIRQLLIMLSYVLSGVFICFISTHASLYNTPLTALFSGILGIILFIVAFNLNVTSISFFPDSLDNYFGNYAHTFVIWSGLYFYQFILFYIKGE